MGKGPGTRAVAASSFHSAGPGVVGTCSVSGLVGGAVRVSASHGRWCWDHLLNSFPVCCAGWIRSEWQGFSGSLRFVSTSSVGPVSMAL